MNRALAVRRPFIVLLAIIASLAITAPAAAIPPEKYTETIPYDFVVPVANNPCEVEIHVVGEVTFTDKFFFDKNGDLIRYTSHVVDVWTETGLPSGGTVNASAALTYTETNFEEFENGDRKLTRRWTGMPIKFQVPGLGLISIDAGNVATLETYIASDDSISNTLLWEHGQHPLFFLSPDISDEWIAAYCDVIDG